MCLEDQLDAVLCSLYLFYYQVTLHVSGDSRIHHQEYTNCSYNLIWPLPSEVAALPWTF